MSGGKTSVPGEFKEIANFARGMLKQTGPLRREVIGQGMEALRTGGVKAQIPMIQQAVSQANQATAQGLKQTAGDLAAKNIGGPFASRLLAQQRMGGEQLAAAIPTQMAEKIINRTLPFAQGMMSAGMGGLGQSGQAAFASDAFNAQQFADIMNGIRSSMQGIGMAMCLHPDTEIETPSGTKKVRDMLADDKVMSLNGQGERTQAKVIAVVSRHVGKDHKMVKSGKIIISPKHPLADGTPFAEAYAAYLRPTTSGEQNTVYTYDILVDSPTGVYFVDGVALGSTLDIRHRRAA